MIPLANSTHGMVIETYDLLRSERVPRDFSIVGDTIIKIEHCLVVSGSEGYAITREEAHTHPVTQQSTPVTTTASEENILKNINIVYSHEQALGQCSGWLDRHLPNAKRVPVSSTAAAAKMLLQPPNHHATTPLNLNKDQNTGCMQAAIASEICLRLYPELRLVQRGVQDDRSTSHMHNHVESHQVSSLLVREPNTIYSDLQIIFSTTSDHSSASFIS